MMKTLEEIRKMPRTTHWDIRKISDEAERFMLTETNPMHERLEAGQIMRDAEGWEDGPFTEADLRAWGGRSGPLAR